MSGNRSSLRIVLGTLIVLVVGIFSPAQAQYSPKQARRAAWKDVDNYIEVLQRAHFGFEKPGVRIELIEKGLAGEPIEAWQHLQLVAGKQASLLKDIHQLQGHVVIKDAPSALRFVRLLTSPETWYLWRNGGREVEVVDSSTLHELLSPGFGKEGFALEKPSRRDEAFYTSLREDVKYWDYEPEKNHFEFIHHTRYGRYVTLQTAKHPDLSAYGDGFMGIVAHKMFLAGGFTPPQVQQAAGGYQIMRWLFMDGGIDHRFDAAVTRIREFVGEDGVYKRTVLQKKAPPNIPGIWWLIRTFE